MGARLGGFSHPKGKLARASRHLFSDKEGIMPWGRRYEGRTQIRTEGVGGSRVRGLLLPSRTCSREARHSLFEYGKGGKPDRGLAKTNDPSEKRIRANVNQIIKDEKGGSQIGILCGGYRNIGGCGGKKRKGGVAQRAAKKHYG